jgi:hypothetical protein
MNLPEGCKLVGIEDGVMQIECEIDESIVGAQEVRRILSEAVALSGMDRSTVEAISATGKNGHEVTWICGKPLASAATPQ